MNSFELNKIMGAVLGTLLFVMGVGFLAEWIYHPIEGRGVGYLLPEPVEEASEDLVAEDVAVPVAVLLASADAAAGASAARRCQSCHTFDESGANRTGPGLYDVVGRTIGGHEGYAYSQVLLDYAAAGEVWSYENLDAFLASPQHFAPGTKMTLAVAVPEERADVLAYLQTLSPSPVPFPEAEAAGDEVPGPVEEAAEQQTVEDAVARQDEEAVEDALPAEDGTEPLAEEAGFQVPQGDDVVEALDPVDADATAVDPATETLDDTNVSGTPTTGAPASDTPPAGTVDPEAPAGNGTSTVPANPLLPAAPTNSTAPAGGATSGQ